MKQDISPMEAPELERAQASRCAFGRQAIHLAFIVASFVLLSAGCTTEKSINTSVSPAVVNAQEATPAEIPSPAVNFKTTQTLPAPRL
jgi:hypothetical protein